MWNIIASERCKIVAEDLKNCLGENAKILEKNDKNVDNETVYVIQSLIDIHDILFLKNHIMWLRKINVNKIYIIITNFIPEKIEKVLNLQFDKMFIPESIELSPKIIKQLNVYPIPISDFLLSAVSAIE